MSEEKSYRLETEDEQTPSPCPEEQWTTRKAAEVGLEYWEKQSGLKLKIVEE